MTRARTSIYLGPETRRLGNALPKARSLSGEIEWAVDGYLALIEDALPAFRLAEWAGVVSALGQLDATRPAQARFIGDELVRAHKRGDGKDAGVDLGSLGYRLGAAPLAVQLSVLHIARAALVKPAETDLQAFLRAVLPARAIKE